MRAIALSAKFLLKVAVFFLVGFVFCFVGVCVIGVFLMLFGAEWKNVFEGAVGSGVGGGIGCALLAFFHH